MRAATTRIASGEIDHRHRATNAPATITPVRSQVAAVSCGLTRSHAAAHIIPTAAASTAARTSCAGRLPVSEVNAHVSRDARARSDLGQALRQTVLIERQPAAPVHQLALQRGGDDVTAPEREIAGPEEQPRDSG